MVYRSAGHIHGWTVSALYLDRWYPTRSRNNIGSHPTLIGAAYTRGGCVGLREVNLGKRCFFEFLETDAGRHWNRKRKQSSGAESIPRLHRLSTRRTPEQLTRDFGIAVRHLLGGELQADLAEEFGVDAATISRACRDIPNLLPRLEAADGRMARYLAAFGWLPVLSSWTSSTGRCCDDIDLDRAQVHVRHALQRVKGVLRHVDLKTDASRRLLALPPTLVEAMLRHRERQQSEREAAATSWRSTDFVFTTVRGEPLDGTAVTHSFQRLLRRAGLPRMRFYDLRHGCASLLLAEGVHPRVVMETLGHSGIGLTMNTYSHVSAALQREAANRIDGVFRPAGSETKTVVETVVSGRGRAARDDRF